MMLLLCQGGKIPKHIDEGHSPRNLCSPRSLENKSGAFALASLFVDVLLFTGRGCMKSL